MIINTKPGKTISKKFKRSEKKQKGSSILIADFMRFDLDDTGEQKQKKSVYFTRQTTAL